MPATKNSLLNIFPLLETRESEIFKAHLLNSILIFRQEDKRREENFARMGHARLLVSSP